MLLHALETMTLQSLMLADFEQEYSQMLTILRTPSNNTQRERASARILVIEESVRQLKKQLANPKHIRIEGGYSPEEIARFDKHPLLR